MYSVLMATCAASGDVENNILHCVETLLTHGAKVNVYDRLVKALLLSRATVYVQMVAAG